MKNYLLNIDKKALRIIRTIGREADRKHLCVYVVGGIVRDMILGKKNLDLDICVRGDAIGLAKSLARKWKAPIIVYKDFQTASIQWLANLRVDFAQTRKERYAYPGALPTVRPGNLKNDLHRRDFTINAMAVSINAGCFGQLIDEFNGLKDLTKKKIRIMHDRSFIDDPTRILRAVRFEQRFNFKIELQTRKLIKSALGKRAETTVKPPRYFSEFKKILIEVDPIRALKRLQKLRGLRFLDEALKCHFLGLARLHKSIMQMKRKPLYSDFDNWWLIYFIDIIKNLNNRALTKILKKFHFTRNEKVSIQQCRNIKAIKKNLAGKKLRASEIYTILKPLPKEVIIYLRASCLNTLIVRRIDCFLKDHINVKLNISGEDLKKMGFMPGREIGKALDNVLCLKIDKHISTKQQELNKAIASLEKC